MKMFTGIYSFPGKCALTMCFIFFSNIAAANSQSEISAFFLGASEDSRVLDSRDIVQSAGAMKSRKVPLEDVEFRVGMDDGGVSDGDYRFRFYLGSFPEAWANSERLQANETMHKTRYNVVLSKALRKRYRQFLSVEGLSNELAVGERRITLLEEQVSAYKSFVDSPDFRFVTLIDVEQDLVETRLKQMRLQRARNEAAVVLREYGVTPENSLNDSWLKSVDEVMKTFDNSLPLEVPGSDSPLLSNKASAVVAAEKYLDWQRTKDNVSLKYLDLGYDNNDSSYTVGFSVKFPFGVKNDNAVVKAKTRLNAARREQLLLQDALPQELRQSQQTLQELHEAYRLVVKRLQDGSRSESALSASNPFIMFRVLENTLHWELEEAEIRRQILEKYVDILHLSGQLASPPLKNYLSKHDDQL